MKKVDMSANAVTARLKRVAQLRRLGLSLQKAKLHSEGNSTQGDKSVAKNTSLDPRKAK
jgi:hypothetical protein